MKSFWPRSLILVLGFFLLCLGANSQLRESGEIQGTITDTQGEPLPGVAVAVESPNLIGGVQTTVTDVKGSYRFPSLSVGTYKVTVKLAGFKTMAKEGIELHARFNLTCDFKMPQAAITEEIEVVADIPTINTKSSQPRPIIVTDEFLLSLPGKTGWSGLLGYAPGSWGTTALGSAWGTAATQHDGVDVSDPMGGFTDFAVDVRIIKEVSVQTLGLPAEYGHFTGAVLSSVSKSGSNKFSTFHEFRYWGEKWNSQNWKKVPANEWSEYAIPSPDYEYATLPYYNIGSQFGGKIIRDRLWFFIAGEYSLTRSPILGLDSSKDTKNKRGFGKITFQLNNSNKFNLSVNISDEIYTNQGISSRNPENGVNLDYPQYFGSLNWTSIFSPTTFLDVKLGYTQSDNKSVPMKGKEIVGKYDSYWGRYIDNYPYFDEQNSKVYHANVHFSHYLPKFLIGSHDVKVGLEFLKYDMVWDRGSPGNRIENLRNGVPISAQVVPHFYLDTYSRNGIAFIQDQWSFNKRLTLNIGLRYDYYSYYFPEETSVRGTVYSKGAFAPRIGMTYDLLGDRKNIIKLSYGHYFEKMSRAGVSLNNYEHRYAGAKQYTWDAATQTWVLTYEPPPPSAPRDYPVDKDISQPWIREIAGGYEREIFRDATLSVNFWFRSLGDTVYLLNFGSIYEPYTIINPGPDGLDGTADDKGPMQVWKLTNPSVIQRRLVNPRKGYPAWLTEDPKWYSRGFEIRFTKKFSHRWQMMASYLFSRVKGNNDGDSFIMFDPNRVINLYGEMEFYQPHQIKIQGNVLLPFDLSFSAVFDYHSGRLMDPQLEAVIPGVNYAPIYLTAPGSTPKAPGFYNLDIRLEKQFRIKGTTFGLGLDILNATNHVEKMGTFYRTYGPYYLKRLGVDDPRTFLLTLRFMY